MANYFIYIYSKLTYGRHSSVLFHMRNYYILLYHSEISIYWHTFTTHSNSKDPRHNTNHISDMKLFDLRRGINK